MRKVLVTGAAGFIGSNLVRRLLRQRWEIHVLCRPSSRLTRLADIAGRLEIHRVGLEDRRGVRRAVGAIAPEHIVHLAAAAMHGGVAADAAQQVRTNLLGTMHLIDACEPIEYASFLNTGDAFEYGPGRGRRRESAACWPTSIDGISKLAATLYARQAARTRRKPIATLRPFSVFGPRDDPRRLLPRLIDGALREAPLQLSQPAVARDFLFVDDLVDLYLEAMGAADRLAGRVLNAASGRRTTLRQVVDAVIELTGSQSEVRWGAYPTAPHDLESWVADMSLTFEALAWRPRHDLRAGLAATLRWARRSSR